MHTCVCITRIESCPRKPMYGIGQKPLEMTVQCVNRSRAESTGGERTMQEHRHAILRCLPGAHFNSTHLAHYTPSLCASARQQDIARLQV
eukprot:1148390-Pelagomonas_calceolata.AAC.6